MGPVVQLSVVFKICVIQNVVRYRMGGFWVWNFFPTIKKFQKSFRIIKTRHLRKRSQDNPDGLRGK